MKNDYNTKQKIVILEYLKKCDKHITAAEIVSGLKSLGVKISTATVYRRLEKMVSDGIVKKYITEGCACYQYTGKKCDEHFHLKCTECGTLFHVDCSFLKDLAPHILEHHGFTVDNRRTVMYGICNDCAVKEDCNV